MNVQKMKYKLYESHVLYKAAELYKKFKGNIRYDLLINQNLPQLMCVSPIKNKEYVANSLEYFTKLAIIKELLTLLDEVYVKHHIDYNDSAVREIVSKLKAKLPEQLKSLDGAQTVKVIRDSFVHNSEDIHNLKYEYGNLFKVKLRHKLLGDEECFINLSINDLVSIVYIYDESRVLEPGAWGYINTATDQAVTYQALLDSYKKHGNFNSLISIVDKNGNDTPLDSFQNKALFQFLISNKKEMAEYSNKFGYDLGYFIGRYGPLRDNALNNYEFKINYSDNLTLMSLDRTMTAERLANELKKEYPSRYMHFKNSKLYDSVPYSSLAYSIFTQFSRDDLKAIVDKGKTPYSAEEIAHIRNAFVHGRYFYNYNDGFEIYDGTRDLQHVKTLSYDMIVDILKLINNEAKNEPVSIDFSLLK